MRVESKATYTEGLFVLDLSHMPVGCGVWPGMLSIPSSMAYANLMPQPSGPRDLKTGLRRAKLVGASMMLVGISDT